MRVPPDISETPFDVIVVGAGINGCGVARDAAMRGLRVLVLDKNDLASGTTAWSTRLIHGGLRYLEHGELGLVRESLRERERLLRIAPHLVRPLPMLIPFYADARRGALAVRAGMLAYDLLSFDKTLARHQTLSRNETLKRAPGLDAEGLRGAAIYFDAQVEFAERLVVENALAARGHGALFLTYARVERITVEDGAVAGVEFRDVLGGSTHRARGRVVVNTAGAWVDEVLRGADVRLRERLIGGTKGSHLVVESCAGAPAREAIYAEAREDGRPFFVIPWNGRYLVGTTDTRFEGDLDSVAADDAEIEYLLRETNHLLPSARLTRDSILFSYSGVRPLPYIKNGSEAAITRRHFLRDHAPEVRHLISVVGGKLTTYRSLSEEVVNLLFKKLGRSAPACTTDQVALPGAACGAANFADFAARFKAECGLPGAAAERLLRIYGTRAADVLRVASDDAQLLESFSRETNALGAEVVFSFRHEMAETLSDCLWRRTMVGLSSSRENRLEEARAAALVARKFLGWDAARAADEVSAYQKYIERFRPARATLHTSNY